GERVEDSFDATRSAKRKTYRYTLYESEQTNPLLERYALRVDKLPTFSELEKVVKLFEGEHDFKAFCASGSSVKTTVRTVYSIALQETVSYGCKTVELFVTGNGFLYNMVRTIVGTALDLCAGRKTVQDLEKAFATGSRKFVGKTVEAKGLTLYSVFYNEKKV
ncbi:MAG: tRNA pseudouridine(38-40) synthase TruA, partial [Clostridia bacterium]|nr:tRNA pseudouridine(38-40) synthase TruA [Clostridia bacterium]